LKDTANYDDDDMIV